MATDNNETTKNSKEFLGRMMGEDGTIEEFIPQCKKCANYIENEDGSNGTCIGGFGAAIPMDVYLGDVIHNVLIDGDNGMQFIEVLSTTLKNIMYAKGVI